MKNYKLSNQLQNIKDNIEETYRAIKTTVDNAKGLVKKVNKKLMKKALKKTHQLKGNEKFFDSITNYKYENEFFNQALQLKEYQAPINITSNKNVDIKVLIKDVRFLEFLTLIIFFNNIYSNFNSFEKFSTMIKSQMYRDLRDYFGDINKIFLSYCLLNERNITLHTIQNITSFVCNNVVIENENLLTLNQRVVLQQILTGIKEEKQKLEPVNNTEPRIYNKNEKFNILEKVKHTITIKYISNKNGKHSSHSSPITHEREGHLRTLKSGKVIWIGPMIINPIERVA